MSAVGDWLRDTYQSGSEWVSEATGGSGAEESETTPDDGPCGPDEIARLEAMGFDEISCEASRRTIDRSETEERERVKTTTFGSVGFWIPIILVGGGIIIAYAWVKS